MAEFYDSFTFTDYPPTDLLDKDFYRDSLKRLSFQYLTRDNEKLIAYIALKQESPQVEIPDVGNQSKGCRILSLHAKPFQYGDIQITYSQLLDALLDEAENEITNWQDNQNNQSQFDYIWFNIQDFPSDEVIQRFDSMVLNGNIAYKVIDRPNEQPPM